MKTKLIIEIETPDVMNIFPEEGQTENDFKDKEKELEDFRKSFSKEMHNEIVAYIKDWSDERFLEEQWFDSGRGDEFSIEGYEGFEDYGIKINIKEVE